MASPKLQVSDATRAKLSAQKLDAQNTAKFTDNNLWLVELHQKDKKLQTQVRGLKKVHEFLFTDPTRWNNVSKVRVTKVA